MTLPPNATYEEAVRAIAQARRDGAEAERNRIVALFKDPPEDWLRAAREMRTTIDANWNTRAMLSALAEIITKEPK